MARLWLFLGGVNGALGVALGAFGAHALRPVLPLQVMTIFETAVRYHLLHVPALLATGILISIFPEKASRLRYSAWLFLAGMVLFSGSLYAMSLSDIRTLGWLTPLGGVAWVAAWGNLAWIFRPGPGAK